MAEKIALFIAGAFCICAAIWNWDFFFSNYRTKPFSRLFGRNGARIFYIVLGVFFWIIGIFFA